jgi:hypothetical protein
VTMDGGFAEYCAYPGIPFPPSTALSHELTSC